MATTSLRDYQRGLSERLRGADSARTVSKLGIQAGRESWLVDLADAGEVIPVPPVTPVPLTKPWFKGIANIRGNLYSVVDFPALLGADATIPGEQSRLLLISERFRTAAALLVDRSLGLRDTKQLELREAGAAKWPWIKAEYVDAAGNPWVELDVPGLVQHPDFLSVAV